MNKTFFAFGKAVESKERVDFAKYIGVAPLKIVAVNPNKAALETIYNTTLDKEPEYIGTVDRNGVKKRFVRVNFILRTDPTKVTVPNAKGEEEGVDALFRLSFMIVDEPMLNADGTKGKVIDKYGRTAWATKDEIKAKAIPVYANGPARLDADYELLKPGVENLLNFIKAYLGIGNVDEYVDGTWRLRKNPEDYEAGFNDVDKWFTGNVDEIRGAVNLMPTNMVKCLIGVRHSDDGKEYQDVFNRSFMAYRATRTTGIEKALNEAKENGAYKDTTFEVCDLKLYEPKPTNFNTLGEVATATVDDDLPW